MRLIASSQPSGVARPQEIRNMFPRSSLLWHEPHLEITNWLVTGMPSSGAALAGSDEGPFCGAWVCAMRGNARKAATSVFITLPDYHTPVGAACKARGS